MDDPPTNGSLRKEVGDLWNQVWRHHQNKDMYTNLSKNQLVLEETAKYGGKSKGQVDHVWEVQVLNTANAAVREGKGVAGYTRGIETVIKSFVNSEYNLNVTTCDVNQKKKGPFTRWLKGDQSTTLEELPGGLPRGLVDAGYWANIEKSVVLTYNEMEEKKGNLRDARSRDYTEELVDEMNKMMTRMGVE